MILEEAKKLIGREAIYQKLAGKIIRVSQPWIGKKKPIKTILAELDNGLLINIELLKFKDHDGNLKYLT